MLLSFLSQGSALFLPQFYLLTSSEIALSFHFTQRGNLCFGNSNQPVGCQWPRAKEIVNSQ